jgi:hypothetical protein
MWFNLQTISASDALFGVGDADDYIQAVIDGSGNIDVTYRSQSTSETITGNIVDGVSQGTGTTSFTPVTALLG